MSLVMTLHVVVADSPAFAACSYAKFRYLTYGSATAKAAALMAVPEVEDFFTKLIMRVAPKSYSQANGEVVVTRRFLENFSGEPVVAGLPCSAA